MWIQCRYNFFDTVETFFCPLDTTYTVPTFAYWDTLYKSLVAELLGTENEVSQQQEVWSPECSVSEM